jgi:predicted nucleic acid-binding protein
VILIDTGPLVALCDARDAKHKLAIQQLPLLAAQGLATCDAVLTEACFHLPHNSQRQRLRGLLRELDVEPVPTDLDTRFWFEALEWLERYAEHEPDWADACLTVLSGRDRHTKIWTYDREFRTVWRRPNGTAIAMAVA